MEGLQFVRMVPSSAVPVRGAPHGTGAPPHVCRAFGVRAGGASAVEMAAGPKPATSWSRERNWVMDILKVRSLSAERKEEEEEGKGGKMGDYCVGCAVEYENERCDVAEEAEEKKMVFDRDSFSKLLRRVSLKEAQVFVKMSYLSTLAYDIAQIEPGNLLGNHGLRLVTSSLDKKAKSLNAEKEQKPAQDVESEENNGVEEDERQKETGFGISPSCAYHMVASAASYLHSQAKGNLPWAAENRYNSYEGDGGDDAAEACMSSDIASFMAVSSSVTAVVAGKEEMKQAVAQKLNTQQSSPCEWFICDDDKSATRYFVIQGSETLASWIVNLLFDPIQFEGLDVLVHRGIYEAAKGIYEQMLPEVQAHLKSHGKSAKFRFTGHSLGGSLSLLINLMLLIRGEVPASALLPVITFGAPSIMCGGDYLLKKLGLPQTHLQAISMHRDIVPRAFSCHYPDQVAEFLKFVSGNFRNHPCLGNQKLLYAPMGKLLILQPEDSFSPHHHLLPRGSGLYLLDRASDTGDSERQLKAAKRAFLNSPHPLEILMDLGAYGSEGTVYRDHDVNSYLQSLVSVTRREHLHNVWWPLLASPGRQVGVITAHLAATSNTPNQQHHFSFSGMLFGVQDTFKHFGEQVATQCLQLFGVLSFPAKRLVCALLVISIR
ncbi:hypothetical protein J5N97_015352 [Dioscorea zingiberensis]|uniref:Fungal lipase-type domain-containing protein n=1 Tax=Dioscorea zingiberensis TaxID=325984 RepID=A0A9D5HKL7_9LILI|nr:hypothetical protein J5N97_015352 [Dioscorea zingiberensis]